MERSHTEKGKKSQNERDKPVVIPHLPFLKIVPSCSVIFTGEPRARRGGILYRCLRH